MTEQNQKPEVEQAPTTEQPRFDVDQAMNNSDFVKFLAKFGDSEELVERGDTEILGERYEIFKKSKETIEKLTTLMTEEISREVEIVGIKSGEVKKSVEAAFAKLMGPESGVEGYEVLKGLTTDLTVYEQFKTDIAARESELAKRGGVEKLGEFIKEQEEEAQKESQKGKGRFFDVRDWGHKIKRAWTGKAQFEQERDERVAELKQAVDGAKSVQEIECARRQVKSALELLRMTVSSQVSAAGQGMRETVRQKVAAQLQMEGSSTLNDLKKKQALMKRLLELGGGGLVSEMLAGEATKIEDIKRGKDTISKKERELEDIKTRRERIAIGIQEQGEPKLEEQKGFIKKATDRRDEVAQQLTNAQAERPLKIVEIDEQISSCKTQVAEIEQSIKGWTQPGEGAARAIAEGQGNIIRLNAEIEGLGKSKEKIEENIKILEIKIKQENGLIEKYTVNAKQIDDMLSAERREIERLDAQTESINRELDDLRQEDVARTSGEQPIDLEKIQEQIDVQAEEAVRKEIQIALGKLKNTTAPAMEGVLKTIFDHTEIGSKKEGEVKDFLRGIMEDLKKAEKDPAKRILMQYIINKRLR